MIETGYTVTYNGLSPWGTGFYSGLAAPYVSLDLEEVWQAGRQGILRTVTLNGTIPSGGLDRISQLTSAFSQNFKTFSAPNITMPCALVQDVTFSPQDYFGKVDYTIVLKDYSGFSFNVTNPVDETSFVQEADGSVTVNHKISAIGLDPVGCSLGTAFANARTFVQSRTGMLIPGLVNTMYIPDANSGSFYVVSQQETIDRTAPSYAITETFKWDNLRLASNIGFKRFSAEYISGINEDYAQVSINATYRAGEQLFDTGLFNQVSESTDIWPIATSIIPNGLNRNPVSFAVETDEIEEQSPYNVYTGIARVINIKAVYDTLPSSAFFDYEVETTKDFRNGVTQASIKGVINGVARHIRQRYANAYSFFTSNMGSVDGAVTYLYQLASGEAIALGYTSYPFNKNPKNFSIVFNSGQGLINLNATFDDAPFVDGYSEFNWQVTTDCGLNVYRPHMSVNVNGFYQIQDLGILNRTSISLNGSFAYPATGTFTKTTHDGMKAVLYTIEGTTNAFLDSESYNITKGDAIRTGFSYTYSRDGTSLINFPSDGRIMTNNTKAGITIPPLPPSPIGNSSY